MEINNFERLNEIIFYLFIYIIVSLKFYIRIVIKKFIISNTHNKLKIIK